MRLAKTLFVVFVILAVAALLTACAPLPPEESATGPTDARPTATESVVLEPTAVAPAPAEPTVVAPMPTEAPAGAGQPPAGATGVLTGTVTYLERIALPADARIAVQLVDVSRADAPALVLAEQVFRPNGRQVPLPFELRYDPKALDERYTYAVQARIEIGDALRWINTERYAVLTRGAPLTDVEVKVTQVSARPAAAAPTGLDGRNWMLVSYGAPGAETPVPGGLEVSAAFSKETGQVAGRAACNRYFATYQVGVDKLTISQAGVTRMMCAPEQMALEAAYLKALSAVESYTVDGDTLQVVYDGGQGVLNFAVQK